MPLCPTVAKCIISLGETFLEIVKKYVQNQSVVLQENATL